MLIDSIGHRDIDRCATTATGRARCQLRPDHEELHAAKAKDGFGIDVLLRWSAEWESMYHWQPLGLPWAVDFPAN